MGNHICAAFDNLSYRKVLAWEWLMWAGMVRDQDARRPRKGFAKSGQNGNITRRKKRMPPLKGYDVRRPGDNVLCRTPPAAGVETIEAGEGRGSSVVRRGVVLAPAREKKLRIQPREIYLFDLMAGLTERLGSGIIVKGNPSTDRG